MNKFKYVDKLLIGISVVIVLNSIILLFFKPLLNNGDSIPNVLFLQFRFQRDNNFQIGDYIIFNHKTKYLKEEMFVKIIGGVSENIIHIDHFNTINNIQSKIIVNNKIFQVKNKTAKGTKLTSLFINNTIIPPNKYFVYGLNEDSFDSRYREFGLIDQNEIIGKVIPCNWYMIFGYISASLLIICCICFKKND